MKTVIVFAPHTDDAEFGCGGTIHRMIKDGYEVHIVALSSAAKISEQGMGHSELIDESYLASGVLGLPPDHLNHHEFEVRKFGDRRQEILDLMIYYRKKLLPDIVFIPCKSDIHQDHEVVHNEAIRAFKYKTILCYEMAWNNLSFEPNLSIELTLENVRAKIDACMEYKSQRHRLTMEKTSSSLWPQCEAYRPE